MVGSDSNHLSEYTFDWTAEESVSAAIVHAVAKCSEQDPAELEPIYDAIDPDALDLLFASLHDPASRTEGTVEFPYHGYDVRVSASGRGIIRPQR